MPRKPLHPALVALFVLTAPLFPVVAVVAIYVLVAAHAVKWIIRRAIPRIA